MLPIKHVSVVGCGGNGSIFITHLCRILQAWTTLGGEPFKITLFDPDVVTEANLARQVFCAQDIGLPKAMVLAMRMKAFFGVPVEFKVANFTVSSMRYPMGQCDAVVGCVDNLKARKVIAAACRPNTGIIKQWGESRTHKERGRYWLDLGNSDRSGQVVLGGHGLPNLFDVLPQLKTARDPKHLPSCSMAEALSRQDLFINSLVATLAANLLWQLMRHGRLEHHGYFINLGTGRVQPIAIPPCPSTKKPNS